MEKIMVLGMATIFIVLGIYCVCFGIYVFIEVLKYGH